MANTAPGLDSARAIETEVAAAPESLVPNPAPTVFIEITFVERSEAAASLKTQGTPATQEPPGRRPA